MVFLCRWEGRGGCPQSNGIRNHRFIKPEAVLGFGVRRGSRNGSNSRHHIDRYVKPAENKR